MVNLDNKAFLSLFKLPDLMPACGEGMELARLFLQACGDAVADVKTADDLTSASGSSQDGMSLSSTGLFVTNATKS